MTPPDRAEAFVFLLARHERQIAGYVMTLVPQLADAEDILQQAKVVMWRQFHQFEAGTNFGAWARKIAFHQILSYRRSRRRDPVQLSDAFLTAVAEETERAGDALEERQRRLATCLETLRPEHRRVLDLRYQERLGIEALAARVDRTVAAVYRLLSRIRAHLHACVSNQPTPETLDEAEPQPS
jgi:RNA polymerase sigma-70 factor (ECF subfamily)